MKRIYIPLFCSDVDIPTKTAIFDPLCVDLVQYIRGLTFNKLIYDNKLIYED